MCLCLNLRLQQFTAVILGSITVVNRGQLILVPPEYWEVLDCPKGLADAVDVDEVSARYTKQGLKAGVESSRF